MSQIKNRITMKRLVLILQVITKEESKYVKGFYEKTKEYKMAKIYSPDLKSTKNRKEPRG